MKNNKILLYKNLLDNQNLAHYIDILKFTKQYFLVRFCSFK